MTDSETHSLEIEIFRAGDYGERGNYGEAELDAIAEDYAADLHEAPVTIDHQQEGAAHGWVSQLRRVGDRLLARLEKLSPELMASIKSHRLKKRSVELYRQFQSTGRPYLKAVTFLGAGAPAVKGLTDPCFSDPEGNESLRFTETLTEKPDETFRRNEIRRRLMEGNAWRPFWEHSGLLDALASIESESHLSVVLEAFRETSPTPPIGKSQRQSIEFREYPDTLSGVTNPQHQDLHYQALALMDSSAGITFGQALRRVSGRYKSLQQLPLYIPERR